MCRKVSTYLRSIIWTLWGTILWSTPHLLCLPDTDFELMIHLYNLGFNGRYCAYPDCEFQEGITRTFDEEAGRHRKFSLGAHELVFNPFQDMLGHGIFTPLFRTFLSCDIPSYYKVFLTAYLCSYTSGGAYIIVFVASAIARILDSEDIKSLYVFSPAGVIILNFIIYYVLGYITFIISLLRMHYVNNKLLFAEYRKKWFGGCCLVFVKLRYCLVFQFFFYSVATFTFYFLGSMDHLLSRPGIVSATNKDSINIGRCTAFWDMVVFNSGSWLLALIIGGLAYVTVLQDEGWDVTSYPSDSIVEHALFAGPALLLMLMTFLVPIFFNPYILGWPFLRQPSKKQQQKKRAQSKKKRVRKDKLGREIVDFNTFMTNAAELQEEIERVEGRPDIEIGSLATKDLRSGGGSPATSPNRGNPKGRVSIPKNMYSITESDYEQPSSGRNSRPTSSSSRKAQSHHANNGKPRPSSTSKLRFGDDFQHPKYKV